MLIKRTLFCSLGLVVSVAIAALLWLAPGTLHEDSPQWKQWARHQRITAAAPAIDRLYNFQDTSATDAKFSNHAGIIGQLTLERPQSEKSSDAFSLTEGRWPWKQAVRLRHAALHSRLSVPTRQAFSFHTWFRHFGEASAADSFYGTVCSVMSMGDGVHVGWCLQLLRPCNTLLFSIGQPKGAPAVSISSRVQIPEGLWTAVAGTWNGRELRLYVNGLLYAAVPWQGSYWPPKSHSRFRLGLAGNGSLAGCLEFDEVALFDRCLDAAEIARLTWPELPADSPRLQPLLTAGERLADGKPDSSLQSPNDSRVAKPNNPQLAALHTLRRSEIQRQLEQFDHAQTDLESLAADPAVPDSLRLLAIHEATRIRLGIRPNWRLQNTADRPDQWSLCRDYTGDQQLADQIRSALQLFTAKRWMEDYQSHVRPLLQNRCGGCHSLDLGPDTFTSARLQQQPAAANSASAWEQAFSEIATGQMPPQGQPPLAEYDRKMLIRWWKTRPPTAFCEQIPTEQNQQHYPGYVRTRRLTRLEYRNAIRDLLGVQLTPEELPPADASGGEGFDTVGDVLFTSPGHIDSWMSSTRIAVRRALQQDLAEKIPENRRLLSVFGQQLPPETPGAADPELIRSLLTATASQAWRRSPAPEEITQLLTLYTTSSTSAPSTLEALVLPLQAVLLSPHFLFIVEPKPAHGSEITRLTASELATRLSLLLWSSIPDAALRQSAEAGKLLQPSELRAQMRRMLDDPRSRALGEAFGVQWLGLDEAAERRPDPELFPEYSPELAADFREEAIRTIAAIFRENRPLSELLAADSVWVNHRLADFYGLAKPPAMSSNDWSRVSAADSGRGGTAGMAAVLTSTSYARRTSPVLRGKWLLQNLLGSTVEPPPPGIPALENADVGNQPATMRDRLEAHRRDPDCAACHEVMDPLGFSLEHFDAIGRWRTLDNGLPVDAFGKLPDGTAVNGPAGLKQALLARENEFLRHFTRRFLGYAVGRSLTTIDDCLVERCLERLRETDNRAHSLLEEIILSYPFQHRYSMQANTEP